MNRRFAFGFFALFGVLALIMVSFGDPAVPPEPTAVSPRVHVPLSVLTPPEAISGRPRATDTHPPIALSEKVQTADRRSQLEYWPCSDCHTHFGGEKALAEEGHPTIRFRHMADGETCTLCHSAAQPDELNLRFGRTLSFARSHELCGGCHGEKFEDWNQGIHGKQSGSWRDVRRRWTCVECHDAHDPAYKTMPAYRAPAFPEFGIPKKH